MGVLGLVEQAEHELRGVQAEMLADVRVRDLGAQEDLRRAQRSRGDDDDVGIDPLGLPPASTYSTPVASGPSPRSSITTRCTNEFGLSTSAPDSTFRWMYVFIVDFPAFVGQPWRHEPHCSQFSST